jgi:hypothetical protein
VVTEERQDYGTQVSSLRRCTILLCLTTFGGVWGLEPEADDTFADERLDADERLGTPRSIGHKVEYLFSARVAWAGDRRVCADCIRCKREDRTSESIFPLTW